MTPHETFVQWLKISLFALAICLAYGFALKISEKLSEIISLLK